MAVFDGSMVRFELSIKVIIDHTNYFVLIAVTLFVVLMDERIDVVYRRDSV
jgi:hypothetical protein